MSTRPYLIFQTPRRRSTRGQPLPALWGVVGGGTGYVVGTREEAEREARKLKTLREAARIDAQDPELLEQALSLFDKRTHMSTPAAQSLYTIAQYALDTMEPLRYLATRVAARMVYGQSLDAATEAALRDCRELID